MVARLAVLAGLLAMLAAGAAQAQDTKWMVRVRAIDIRPSAGSSPVPGVDVDDKWAPEVDFTYFFTKNLAAELILTYPQKHDVTLNGAPIGSVKHLPPTLTLQYHFDGGGAFRPYVGAGINYTRFSSVNLSIPPALTMEKDSFGWALQVGVDYALSRSMVLNFDVKKVKIEADLFAAGAYLTTLEIDPIIAGVGLGWKF